MHLWIVYGHILGALAFMLAHGVSAVVVFRLRSERDPAAVRLLLGLSKMTLPAVYLSLLLLIVAGVWAGIDIGAFNSGQMWLWTAVGVLVVVFVTMFALVSPTFYRTRDLLGDGSTPVDPADLDRRLSSSRPLVGVVIALIGILVILWLMVLKPFWHRSMAAPSGAGPGVEPRPSGVDRQLPDEAAEHSRQPRTGLVRGGQHLLVGQRRRRQPGALVRHQRDAHDTHADPMRGDGLHDRGHAHGVRAEDAQHAHLGRVSRRSGPSSPA